MTDLATPSAAVRSARPKRVLVLGATGSIGRATVGALVRRGHDVVCFVRPRAGIGGALTPEASANLLRGSAVRFGDVTDPQSLFAMAFAASASMRWSRVWLRAPARRRTPGPSTIRLMSTRSPPRGKPGLRIWCCCRRSAFRSRVWPFNTPSWRSRTSSWRLALTYSIVRPTALFKSLSGQVDRVKRGRPFLVFGDGALTACKPISDDDLGCLPC